MVYLESEEHFTHFGWKNYGLAKKSALLTEAQMCYHTSEWLIYLIHHNWYESYSPVLVKLQIKANIYERYRICITSLHWLESQDLKPG